MILLYKPIFGISNPVSVGFLAKCRLFFYVNSMITFNLLLHLKYCCLYLLLFLIKNLASFFNKYLNYYIIFIVIGEPFVIYMGKDKFESMLLSLLGCIFLQVKLSHYFDLPDEELLKWAWPEDIWFHVDKHSSAHVYLRLREAVDPANFEVDPKLVEDCSQLVKANSIEVLSYFLFKTNTVYIIFKFIFEYWVVTF